MPYPVSFLCDRYVFSLKSEREDVHAYLSCDSLVPDRRLIESQSNFNSQESLV